MYQLLAKKGQLFAILLGVVVVALYLGTVISGISGAGYSMSDDLNQVLKNNPDQKFDFFNLGLGLTIALVAIAAVAAVLFGLFQMISSPKNSLKGIIGIAVIIGLFFLLYSSASTDFDSVIGKKIMQPKFAVTENISKMISGGIKTTAILAIGAFVSMVLLEIYNIFK